MKRNPAYEDQSPGQGAQLNLHSNPAYEGNCGADSEQRKRLEVTYEVITYQTEDFENSVIKAHDYELPDEEQPVSSSADGKNDTLVASSTDRSLEKAATLK